MNLAFDFRVWVQGLDQNGFFRAGIDTNYSRRLEY